MIDIRPWLCVADIAAKVGKDIGYIICTPLIIGILPMAASFVTEVIPYLVKENSTKIPLSMNNIVEEDRDLNFNITLVSNDEQETAVVPEDGNKVVDYLQLPNINSRKYFPYILKKSKELDFENDEKSGIYATTTTSKISPHNITGYIIITSKVLQKPVPYITSIPKVPKEPTEYTKSTKNIPWKSTEYNQLTQKVPRKLTEYTKSTIDIPKKPDEYYKSTKKVPKKSTGHNGSTQKVPKKATEYTKSIIKVPRKSTVYNISTQNVTNNPTECTKLTQNVPMKLAEYNKITPKLLQSTVGHTSTTPTGNTSRTMEILQKSTTYRLTNPEVLKKSFGHTTNSKVLQKLPGYTITPKYLQKHTEYITTASDGFVAISTKVQQKSARFITYNTKKKSFTICLNIVETLSKVQEVTLQISTE